MRYHKYDSLIRFTNHSTPRFILVHFKYTPTTLQFFMQIMQVIDAPKMCGDMEYLAINKKKSIRNPFYLRGIYK